MLHPFPSSLHQSHSPADHSHQIQENLKHKKNQNLLFSHLQTFKKCTQNNVLCTLYSVLCTMYSVQCTLCNVLCAMYYVLCTMYNVQYIIYSVLCTLYSVLCTLYSVLCTLYSMYIKHLVEIKFNVCLLYSDMLLITIIFLF